MRPASTLRHISNTIRAKPGRHAFAPALWQSPIHSTYFIGNADFISCSLDTYVMKFDMLKNLKKGGVFLLNTDMSDEALIAMMPNRVKHQLAKKNAKFYVIDANKIAREVGLDAIPTRFSRPASFISIRR
jgi:Pyruvate/2-oxoacid:ferredoxin oxidoreductase gamma subunit